MTASPTVALLLTILKEAPQKHGLPWPHTLMVTFTWGMLVTQ